MFGRSLPKYLVWREHNRPNGRAHKNLQLRIRFCTISARASMKSVHNLIQAHNFMQAVRLALVCLCTNKHLSGHVLSSTVHWCVTRSTPGGRNQRILAFDDSPASLSALTPGNTSTNSSNMDTTAATHPPSTFISY